MESLLNTLTRSQDLAHKISATENPNYLTDTKNYRARKLSLANSFTEFELEQIWKAHYMPKKK